MTARRLRTMADDAATRPRQTTHCHAAKWHDSHVKRLQPTARASVGSSATAVIIWLEGLVDCTMQPRDAFIDLFGHQSLRTKVGRDCGVAGAKLSRCTRIGLCWKEGNKFLFGLSSVMTC
jgi:hypothetical protein